MLHFYVFPMLFFVIIFDPFLEYVLCFAYINFCFVYLS